MALAGPASAFARRHRSPLFPDVPLLFAAADERYLGSEPLGDNEVATAARNDYPRIVDDILQLLPRTTQVFVVNGAGPHGRFWRSALEEEFRRFRGRVAIVWLDGLSLAESRSTPLCESATRLRNPLRDVRHQSVGRGICGRASVRGPAGHGERPPCSAD